MGKAGRIACIFTPMALTVGSLICLTLTEVSGWNRGTLSDLYFFEANLTNLTIPVDSSNQALTTAVSDVKDALPKIYQIHLWNYCSANSSTGSIDYCSPRKQNFVFDPLTVWGFDIANGSSSATSTSSSNAVASVLAASSAEVSKIEEELLGKSGKEALDAYKTAAKWMFIGYQISFWTTLATILVGVLAIFSRWGSFLTWILSFVSSFFTIASVLTSTVLFAILVDALNNALKAYGIRLSLGTNSLAANWIGVALSWGATLFWLFSVCCCSGRSNPHHRSNKNGLWNAEPKGQGYGPAADAALYGRGRGLQVEKTGGNYQRIESPYMGVAAGSANRDDQVPLQDYAQPTSYSNHHAFQQGAGYEPYRHA